MTNIKLWNNKEIRNKIIFICYENRVYMIYLNWKKMWTFTYFSTGKNGVYDAKMCKKSVKLSVTNLHFFSNFVSKVSGEISKNLQVGKSMCKKNV